MGIVFVGNVVYCERILVVAEADLVASVSGIWSMVDNTFAIVYITVFPYTAFKCHGVTAIARVNFNDVKTSYNSHNFNSHQKNISYSLAYLQNSSKHLIINKYHNSYLSASGGFKGMGDPVSRI